MKTTGEEYCECGRWHFEPVAWDGVADRDGAYSALPDHMPARLGGCTELHGGAHPLYRRTSARVAGMRVEDVKP